MRPGIHICISEVEIKQSTRIIHTRVCVNCKTSCCTKMSEFRVKLMNKTKKPHTGMARLRGSLIIVTSGVKFGETLPSAAHSRKHSLQLQPVRTGKAALTAGLTRHHESLVSLGAAGVVEVMVKLCGRPSVQHPLSSG